MLGRESTYDSGAKLKVIEFAWDMDTLERIEVPHDLDLKNIMFVTRDPINVTITDDTEKLFNSLLMNGGGLAINDHSFELYRPANGSFDGPHYQKADIIRGKIVIFYKAKPQP